MLEEMEAVLRPPWRGWLRAMCSVTGLPSWRFAVPALIVGVAADLADVAATWHMHGVGPGLVALVLSLFVVRFIAPCTLLAAWDAERQEHATTPMRSLFDEALTVWRVLISMLIPVQATTLTNGVEVDNVLQMISLAFYGLSAWAVHERIDRGTPLHRRALDWVVGTLSGLTPNPGLT